MPLNMLVGLIAFTFGAAFGSFLNVVILRYPHQSLGGRSRCPRCQTQLSVGELIPIISWLMLRGRCRHCHTAINWQYPLVETVTVIAAVVLSRSIPGAAANPYLSLVNFLIVAALIVLFVIDLRTMLLPDIFIVILTGLVFIVLITSANTLYFPLLGALLGSGLLLLLWIITSGRGLGFGDVKLMLPLGLLFGPLHTMILLFAAFVCGGLVGLFLLATKRATLKTAVPFGPFLAGVGIIFILFPQVPEYLISIIF